MPTHARTWAGAQLRTPARRCAWGVRAKRAVTQKAGFRALQGDDRKEYMSHVAGNQTGLSKLGWRRPEMALSFGRLCGHTRQRSMNWDSAITGCPDPPICFSFSHPRAVVSLCSRTPRTRTRDARGVTGSTRPLTTGEQNKPPRTMLGRRRTCSATASRSSTGSSRQAWTSTAGAGTTYMGGATGLTGG